MGNTQMRILILEDDIMHYRLMLRLVEEIVPEASCDHAVTGEDACQMFMETEYDLAILDICLRGMDGLQVAKLMFNTPNCEKTGCFAVTGLDEDEYRVAELRSMGLDICFKPVDVAVFRNCVLRALCGGGQARYQANAASRSGVVVAPKTTDGSHPLPVYDKTQGLRASMGSEELLRDVLGTFIENAPERLSQIEMAVTTGDYREAGNIAHAIKGTAATVGAARLSAAAARVVTGARNDFPQEVKEGLSEIGVELESLRKALTDIYGTL